MKGESPFPEHVISLKNVFKEFPLGEMRIRALKEINFDIKQGEFISILGPSGSGKSTLLHVLGLLSKPSGGEVFFEGNLVSSLSDRRLAALRNQKIGFVFQSFHLLNSISALENVELPLVYQRISLRQRRRRALEALDIVGLAHRKNHLPHQLSGGESQRVAIARALVVNPSLVLADEPTGNLDSETGLEILRILKALQAQGVTLVVVTHDPSIADDAQKRIFLQDGSIMGSQKFDGKPLGLSLREAPLAPDLIRGTKQSEC